MFELVLKRELPHYEAMSWRKLSFVGIGFVIAILGIFGWTVAASNRNEAMIVSVLDRGNFYIASTRYGLYQASDLLKFWRHMDTPASMPAGGNLAQESADSPRLLYYTGQGSDWLPISCPGSLFISDDCGKSWAATSIQREQNVVDAFAQPGGAIFAIIKNFVTQPFPQGDSVSRSHLLEQLILSRDNGQTWRDITPHLHEGFAMYGISSDPDHQGLICVRSSQMGRLSQTFVYQADDAAYHWKEYPLGEWHGGRDMWSNLTSIPSGGSNNSNMPATLGTFFKYPYSRSGSFPDLPTKYLTSDKSGYVFRLHQPMPVTVNTVYLFPEAAIKWLDNKNEKVFWGVRVQPEGGKDVISNPQTTELNVDIPGRDAKIHGYFNDPNFITANVDQAHPYSRVVNLDKLYDFSKPGYYRVQLTHVDLYLDHSGSIFGTRDIDVSILP